MRDKKVKGQEKGLINQQSSRREAQTGMGVSGATLNTALILELVFFVLPFHPQVLRDYGGCAYLSLYIYSALNDIIR